MESNNSSESKTVDKGDQLDRDLPPPDAKILTRGLSWAEEIKQCGDYFVFSVFENASFRGTARFVLPSPDGEGVDRLSVRISDGGSGKRPHVRYWQGDPPDGKVNVTLEMTRGSFREVWTGNTSAKRIAEMCLGGEIYVHWLRYDRVQSFAGSFDFTTPMWVSFFGAKGDWVRAYRLARQRYSYLKSQGDVTRAEDEWKRMVQLCRERSGKDLVVEGQRAMEKRVGQPEKDAMAAGKEEEDFDFGDRKHKGMGVLNHVGAAQASVLLQSLASSVVGVTLAEMRRMEDLREAMLYDGSVTEGTKRMLVAPLDLGSSVLSTLVKLQSSEIELRSNSTSPENKAWWKVAVDSTIESATAFALPTPASQSPVPQSLAETLRERTRIDLLCDCIQFTSAIPPASILAAAFTSPEPPHSLSHPFHTLFAAFPFLRSSFRGLQRIDSRISAHIHHTASTHTSNTSPRSGDQTALVDFEVSPPVPLSFPTIRDAFLPLPYRHPLPVNKPVPYPFRTVDTRPPLFPELITFARASIGSVCPPVTASNFQLHLDTLPGLRELADLDKSPPTPSENLPSSSSSSPPKQQHPKPIDHTLRTLTSPALILREAVDLGAPMASAYAAGTFPEAIQDIAPPAWLARRRQVFHEASFPPKKQLGHRFTVAMPPDPISIDGSTRSEVSNDFSDGSPLTSSPTPSTNHTSSSSSSDRVPIQDIPSVRWLRGVRNKMGAAVRSRLVEPSEQSTTDHRPPSNPPPVSGPVPHHSVFPDRDNP